MSNPTPTPAPAMPELVVREHEFRDGICQHCSCDEKDDWLVACMTTEEAEKAFDTAEEIPLGPEKIEAKAIQQVIGEVALKMVREEYSERIREAVKKKMEEDTVEEFVGRFWDNVLKTKER